MNSEDSKTDKGQELPISKLLKKEEVEGKWRLQRSSISDSEMTEIPCPICFNERRKFLYEQHEFHVWKCIQCNHTYVSPQPSEAVMTYYYTTGFLSRSDDEKKWEDNLVRWEGNLGRVYNATVRALAKYMPQRGDLLDVGAGFGGFLERAKIDGWQVSGVEPNKLAFEMSQKRFDADINLQNTSFEQADLAPSSFDCITMLNVIEHVHNPVEICRHAFEILRPGGCLMLRWPQDASRRMGAPAHLHGFTHRSMNRLLHSAGFVEEREYWAGMQDYRHKGVIKYTLAKALGLVAKTVITGTFGKYQIPAVSRLTLAKKPNDI